MSLRTMNSGSCHSLGDTEQEQSKNTASKDLVGLPGGHQFSGLWDLSRTPSPSSLELWLSGQILVNSRISSGEKQVRLVPLTCSGPSLASYQLRRQPADGEP